MYSYALTLSLVEPWPPSTVQTGKGQRSTRVRFNWTTGLRMANVSLFVFRFTARRLHVTSRSAAATIPGNISLHCRRLVLHMLTNEFLYSLSGHTRNLIVRSASAWPQLPRNYGKSSAPHLHLTLIFKILNSFCLLLLLTDIMVHCCRWTG